MMGLYIGRFDPFHLGHLRAYELLESFVDEIKIGIGAQRKDDYFTLSERRNMVIQNTKIEPIYLEDLEEGHSLYEDWGRYVLGIVGKVDLIATGNEDIKKDFSNHEIPVLWLPRYDKISGTEIRRKIHLGDDSWINLVTPASEETIKLSNFYRRNCNG
jgi:nicotinamide-nucleotide adenylyltransferase